MSNREPAPVILGTRRQIELARQRDWVEVLGWAAVIVPILFFIANRGLHGLDTLSGWAIMLNRLSALVGTSLLLVHMILVARVPWIERTMGLDKSTHLHKKLGKPLLYILTFHLLAALANYSIIDGRNLTETLIYLNTHYSDILLATIGLLLMAVVVVTSIRAARKFLSYEAWYLIHLLSYVAVGVAIPHQFSFGTDLMDEPLLNSYFVALYLFVAANVIWYRALRPVLISLRQGLRVTAVNPEKNRTTSVYIGGKKIWKFGAQSGQFFMLRILTPSQWWRPHPFSVSSSEDDDHIRFTIGNRGDDTAKIQDIKVGTRVILEGPFGIFNESKRTQQHVTLVAAGIGVAPVRSLAESLAAEPGDVDVIYRVNDKSDAALLHELEEICERRGHNLHLLSGPRGKKSGWLPDAMMKGEKPDYLVLMDTVPFVLDSDVYICGPSAWANEVVQSLHKIGLPKEQLHVEEFAW